MRNHQHSPQAKRFAHYTIDELKHRATGRWIEILQAAGMPSELLESRRGMPCPKPGCGGNNRFSVMRDLPQRGAVLCRHCFNASTDPRAGDGIATLRWWLGLSLPDAVRWLGDYLGGGVVAARAFERVYSIPITPAIDCKRMTMLADVWRRNMRPDWTGKASSLLGLPADPLLRLGVGWSPTHGATSWPMRNGCGDVIGIRLRCPRTAQKWSVKGSAAGLFYDVALLSVVRPKRLWVVEGPTDTAAVLSIGCDAVGCPSAGGGADYLRDLALRLLPHEIAIIADRDTAGRQGAERLADALLTIAPVRIILPPDAVKDARAWVLSGVGRESIESAADASVVRSIEMEDSIHG